MAFNSATLVGDITPPFAPNADYIHLVMNWHDAIGDLLNPSIEDAVYGTYDSDGAATDASEHALVRFYENDDFAAEVLAHNVPSVTANGQGGFTQINLGDNFGFVGVSYDRGTIWVTATDLAGNESEATMIVNDITGPAITDITLDRESRRYNETNPIGLTVTLLKATLG